jgi:hypothetical protein
MPRRSSSRDPLKILPLASLPLIALTLLVVAFAFGVRGRELAMVGLAVLTGMIGIVPILLDQLRPPEKRNVLISLVSLTYVLAFAVPVYTEYFLNEGQMTGMAGWAGIGVRDLLVAQTGALVGFIALLLGYALPIGSFAAYSLPQPRRDWPLTWCFGVALFMIPLGWSLFLAGQLGLIPARAGSGVLGAFASSYYFGIALLALVWIRYRSHVALWMMVGCVPPTMAFSFFTGSKSLFLLPLMMVAFAYIVETRRIRMSWVLGAVLLIVMIYPLASFQRHVLLAENTLTATDALKNPVQTLSILSQFVSSADWQEYFLAGLKATGNRFNSLGITSIIMRDTPDRVPYQGGWSIGNIVIAYVPRIFWPGKPDIAIGQWITSNYGPGPHIRSHTAPSWIGEFYMNFGYLGIVGGMMVMGVYIRLVHTYLFRPNATIPIALAAVAALQAIVLAVEKALFSPINGLTFKLIPLVVVHVVWVMLSGPAPRRRPESAAEAPSEL